MKNHGMNRKYDIGEFILCKKNGYHHNYIKGKLYRITAYSGNVVNFHYHISGENLIYMFYRDRFAEYFYSDVEIRKLKLEEIDSNL